MSYPVLTGVVLIEANGAALNNAGQDSGTRAENAIVVKQVRIGRLRYPYVSGQAWRRWWREVLYDDFGWEPSPLTLIPKPQQIFTAGDPVRYAEDDMFGYMVARKRATGKGKKGNKAEEGSDEAAAGQSGTYRRVSPLKNSLLISVLPNVIERDFGHFTRNLAPGDNPLLFESELYSTYLQGAFTISLSDAGRFTVGEMADLPEEMIKTSPQNLEQIGNSVYSLPRGERLKRVQETICALAYLRGGARLARNLSDVAPVVVLIGFLDGGNAPFQRLFVPDDHNERVILNLARLKTVLEDYGDRVLFPGEDVKGADPGKPVLFGYRPGVLANEEEVLNAFTSDDFFARYIEVAGTPRQAIFKAADYLAGVLP